MVGINFHLLHVGDVLGWLEWMGQLPICLDRQVVRRLQNRLRIGKLFQQLKPALDKFRADWQPRDVGWVEVFWNVVALLDDVNHSLVSAQNPAECPDGSSY
jgi:hypothetical protein